MSTEERKSLITNKQNPSLRTQCDWLDVPRSSLYVAPQGESDLNLELMAQIDKRHLDYPTQGVLQMQDFLRNNGYEVNVKRIRRLFRKMGIEAIYPKQNLSKLGKAKYIHSYLLRNYKMKKANEVWAIDISYIPMKKGYMYLTAVIDLYSRYIVGWSLSNSLEALTQTALIEEITASGIKPTIINSDQGSQYTSKEWTELLPKLGIQISMDGKGRATDNAFVERFFRTIKQEYVYLYPVDTVKELREGIGNFIRYYNENRSHQGIDRRTPKELYKPGGNTAFTTFPTHYQTGCLGPFGCVENMKNATPNINSKTHNFGL